METYFLPTKVRVPPQPRHVVRREQLVDALNAHVLHHKLTLVSAPAGAGKTTLLCQWARQSRTPVAWVSLSEDDDDPERFLRYLLKAWAEVQPEVGERPPGWLLSSMHPDLDSVLVAFINLADQMVRPLIVVIDDYHRITDQTIHGALTFLLDNSPPGLHIVLSSRAEPPLPLARYRARGELFELRASDLRFELDETREFLSAVATPELSDEQVRMLHERLEGWAAGLQLAALGLPRADRASPSLEVSGRHRDIADYLAEDVFAFLPEELQHFLLQTSILERLSAPLCDAVTGRRDSQEILEHLERENLFLVPMDTSRRWYRYQEIFADFLRERLSREFPEQVPHLHSRAGRWYLARGLPEHAFHHAIDAADVVLTVEICDRYFNAKLQGGELRTVQQWLQQIPQEWIDEYPVLGLARAGLMAFSGDIEGCLRCIDEIEAQLVIGRGSQPEWQVARVTTIRCFISCVLNDLPSAESYAARALQELPEEDLGFRPGIYAALGDVYRANGMWAAAKSSYLKALQFTESPGIRVQAAHVFGALADLDLRQGHLYAAANQWRKALLAIQEGESWVRVPLPVLGWVYVRLAEILYEWNQRDEASAHVEAGLERAELGGDVRSLIAGYLMAGRLRLAVGDTDGAGEFLERARPLVEQVQFQEWIGRFERFQLDLWLAGDRLRAAVNWSDSMLVDGVDQQQPEHESARLAAARVLVLRGDPDSIRRARAEVDAMLDQAAREGRTGLQVEALLLGALIQWKQGDQSAAMMFLERSLSLAEPEGYVRLFADYGLPAARLLQEAYARNVRPDYVQTLLSAFHSNLIAYKAGVTSLPEPLTEREIEVLTLLAAGLSNREIAEALYISSQTVKKHTGNIYGKLGVRSRTEAVARARALDLLS